jgi:hypothetical protein
VKEARDLARSQNCCGSGFRNPILHRRKPSLPGNARKILANK